MERYTIEIIILLYLKKNLQMIHFFVLYFSIE